MSKLAEKTLSVAKARTRRRAPTIASSIGSVPGRPTPAEWCVGIVQADEGGSLSVSSGDLLAHANCAASCLLEPKAGDSVACLRLAPDEVWIMAVLQREEGVPSVMRFSGETTLQVEQGTLNIHAAQIRLDSEQLDVSNQRTRLATESAEVVGRNLRVVATAVKLVGSVLSTVMDRVNHFSKHYLRTTEGIDRVSATHVECEAQQLMRLDAQHTLISGEQLVKARGAQIHFG